MDWAWIFWDCFVPSLRQGALIALPLLLPSLLLRLVAQWRGVTSTVLNILASGLGLGVLWWYYQNSVAYFVVLSLVIYAVLLSGVRRKGVAVAGLCVAFIVACELLLASPAEWHKVRGSFLVLVMKLVSLTFDLELPVVVKGEIKLPAVSRRPSLIEYTSFCFLPATTIFGPFLTFSQHSKFLEPTPLSPSWLWAVLRSLSSSILCLGVSVCFMPFLFNEPVWNKWFAAYSAAASFRYSHYFVSLLSESTSLAAGIGYEFHDGSVSWSKFRVVRPLPIELPRSLGSVVTSWNLPMHLFLKNYVFKPSLVHVGRFGGILITYIASAMLHGLNFQLAAVLLSIGLYAYIENVVRYRLSRRLDACVLDRACPPTCHHRHTKVWWVLLVNAGFSLLAVFHLAYLGLMFGGHSPEEDSMELEGYSMMHTLRKWAHLNFLSHWVALFTYIVSLLL